MKPVPKSAQERSTSDHEAVGFCRTNPSEGRGPCHWGLQCCFPDQKTYRLCPLVPRSSKTFLWCDLPVCKSGSTVIVSSGTHCGEVIPRKASFIMRTSAPTVSPPTTLHQSVRPRWASWNLSSATYLKYLNIRAEPQWRIWKSILEESLLGIYFKNTIVNTETKIKHCIFVAY